MKITAEAVRERIAALEAAGELSLKEQFYLDALRALLPGLAEPVARFDAVADLYALKTLAGQTYNYTASPHEAEQWLGTEGYSVQEYVKLERLQQAGTAPDEAIDVLRVAVPDCECNHVWSALNRADTLECIDCGILKRDWVRAKTPPTPGHDYKAIVERIAEILHGKVTDIDLLTVTVQAMKERNSKLERQAIQPLPIGELLKRLEEQTGEPWSKAYLAGINLETGGEA